MINPLKLFAKSLKSDIVNSYLQPPSKENWGLLMGRTLLAYRNQNHDAFMLSCKDTTSRLLAQMDGESKGENALRSGYQSVLGLHIIAETKHAQEVLQR